MLHLKNKKGAALAFVLFFILIFSVLSVPLLFSVNSLTSSSNQSMLKEQAQLTANSVMESFLATTQNETMSQVLTYVLKTGYKYSTTATIPTELSSYTDNNGVATAFLEKPVITLERRNASQILVTSTIHYKDVAFFNKNSLSVYVILDANLSGAENGGLTPTVLDAIHSYSFIKTDDSHASPFTASIDFEKNAAIGGMFHAHLGQTKATTFDNTLYLDEVVYNNSTLGAPFINIKNIEIANNFQMSSNLLPLKLHNIPNINIAGNLSSNGANNQKFNIELLDTTLNVNGNVSNIQLTSPSGSNRSSVNIGGSLYLDGELAANPQYFPSNLHVNGDFETKDGSYGVAGYNTEWPIVNIGGNFTTTDNAVQKGFIYNLRPSSVITAPPSEATINDDAYPGDFIFNVAEDSKFYPLKKLSENPLTIETPSNLASRPIKMTRSADGKTITVTLSNGVFSEKKFKELANNPTAQTLVFKVDNTNSSQIHIDVKNDDGDANLSFASGKFNAVKYELDNQNATLPVVFLYTTQADNSTKPITIKIQDTDFFGQKLGMPYFIFVDNNPNHSFEFGIADTTNNLHSYYNVSLYAPSSTVNFRQTNTEFIGGFLFLSKFLTEDIRKIKVTGIPNNLIPISSVLEDPTDLTWPQYIKDYAALTKWTVNAHLTKKP